MGHLMVLNKKHNNKKTQNSNYGVNKKFKLILLKECVFCTKMEVVDHLRRINNNKTSQSLYC